MRLRLYIGVLLCFFSCNYHYSQDQAILDSVLLRLKNPENDTVRIDLLNTAASQFQNSNLKKVKLYADSALLLSNELDYSKGKVRAYFNLGNLNYIKGDFTLTLDYYTKALIVFEETNNREGIASALMGIGNVYGIIGEIDKSVDYQKQSLEIRLELGDSLGVAGNYNNLGSTYSEIGEYELSLEYHFKALAIKDKLDYRKGMSSSYGNIGSVYNKQGKYEEALVYQGKALEIREELNNKKGMAMSYTDIGGIYFSLGNYKDALESQLKSLEIAQDVGFGKGIVNALQSISSTYEKDGNSTKALQYYKAYKVAQDSLFNLDKVAEITRIESQYESEKQELEIANLNKEKKIKAVEFDQEKRKGYITYAGFVISLLIAGLILIALINKRKANKKIHQQKKEVEIAKEVIEEKQEEILDSIYYAKHIQKAILPSQKFIHQYLPESFVLYKPKSIVSGDFYWMETIDNKIIFAAADCTGHGVPGAIVSVVCHNALNRAIREFGFLDPGKILDKTNELVEETFSKSEEKVRDGMDIALCVIDLRNKILKFSGAKNPLWIIRKASFEIEEIIATSRPIGFNDLKAEYFTNTVNINPGDKFYMFSDGFCDQFGGVKGKKYKQKKFKDILLKQVGISMINQKNILEKEFENWRGEIEQIDDVCVIGFEF